MRTNYTYLDAWKEGTFEFSMTTADAQSCCHPGHCDYDVKEVMKKRYIKRQLAKLSDEFMREYLSEFGCDMEQGDRHTLEMRIVWCAAGNIVDDLYEKECEKERRKSKNDA
jgi:hypothetical protein